MSPSLMTRALHRPLFYFIASFLVLTRIGFADVGSAASGKLAQPEPGQLRWAKLSGGNPIAVATTPEGAIYVTGNYWSSPTFDYGEPNETTLPHTNHSEFYLAKYNPDRTLAWVKRSEIDRDSEGNSLAQYCMGIGAVVVPDGGVIVIGKVVGSAKLMSGEVIDAAIGEPKENVSDQDESMFIAKYSAGGGLEWVKQALGISSLSYLYPNFCVPSEVAATSDGGAVVTGVCKRRVMFGKGEPNETTNDHEPLVAYEANMFVARYGPDGSLAWVKFTEGFASTRRGGQLAQQIAIAPDGGILVAVTVDGGVTFAPHEPNELTLGLVAGLDIPDNALFLAKYNPNGSFAWAKVIGEDSHYNHGFFISDFVQCNTYLAACPDGTILISGMDDPTDGIRNYEDPLPPEYVGLSRQYISRLSSSGNVLATAVLQSGDGVFRDMEIVDLSVSSTGQAIVLLQVAGLVRFHPGTADEVVLPYPGHTWGMLVAGFDTSMKLKWTKLAYPLASNEWSELVSRTMNILDNDDIIVAGDIIGRNVFGPGEPGETELEEIDFPVQDAFIAKFDSGAAEFPEIQATANAAIVRTSGGEVIVEIENVGVGDLLWAANIVSGSEFASITSVSEGTNTGTLTVTVAENVTPGYRETHLVISAQGAVGSPNEIVISQYGAGMTGSVAGVVKDAVFHAPISGARVFVTPGDFETTTDENGEYIISAIPAGACAVEFYANDHRTDTKAISIEPDVTTTIDIELAYSPGNINGDAGVDAVDIQLIINSALGLPANDFWDFDLNNDGGCSAVDVQLIINLALGAK